MPFAGFDSFGACEAAQKRKGKSDESAAKICGFLQARSEGKKSAEFDELTKGLSTESADRVKSAVTEYLARSVEDGDGTQEEIKDVKKSSAEGIISLGRLGPQEREAAENVIAYVSGLEEGDVEILTEGDLHDVLKSAAIDPTSVEEIIIDEAFITGGDEPEVVTISDTLTNRVRQEMNSPGFMNDLEEINKTIRERKSKRLKDKAEIAKTAVGTTQQMSELGGNKTTMDLSIVEIVEPPYPPDLLAAFLEVDETHFRCVRAKVTDSVGRNYTIEPSVTVEPDEDEDKEGRPVKPKNIAEIAPVQNNTFDPIATGNFQGAIGSLQRNADGAGRVGGANRPATGHKRNGAQRFIGLLEIAKSFLSGSNDMAGTGSSPTKRKRIVSQEIVDDEIQVIEDFIEDCNEMLGFEGVLDRAGMDYESIGWAAIEVIRSRDMKIARIAHAPATRMRVLKGWAGFVEVVSDDRSDGSTIHRGKYTYYQPFGHKVVSKRRNGFTGQPMPYDPKVDGELTSENAEWNMVDRETGMPTTDVTMAANEIIWIPRHHSNTIYYGYTDVVPALGWVLANVHIRDYLLQFFEHNTVPRYAIIIEGAKLAEPVKKAITQYFSTHVKGKAHKTLILPIPAMRGEVNVRFEKLDADNNEGSFQETKKNNAQSIMTAHGVSPAIIGIADKAELGSGKGLSQAEIYKDRIITPAQRYWADKINRMFRIGLGITSTRLKFHPLDIRDEKAEQEMLMAYMHSGVATINGVRKRTGLGEPVQGGDRAFIILGTQIIYLDEMTEAMGTEREALEAEIEANKAEMAMAVVKTSADNQVQSAKISAQQAKSNGASKPPGGGGPASQSIKKPKPGTSNKPRNVSSRSTTREKS